jgi:hypothetical protein
MIRLTKHLLLIMLNFIQNKSLNLNDFIYNESIFILIKIV